MSGSPLNFAATFAVFIATLFTGHVTAQAAPPPAERRPREPEDRSAAPPEPSPNDDGPTHAESSSGDSIIAWRSAGCPLGPQPDLARALLALQPQPDTLLSVEAWADSDIYIPDQTVHFHLRVPRRSYVTLFWLGPGNDVFVPFADLPAAAHRDLVIDADVVITPPLGRERWVVVASPERLGFRCDFGARARVGWVKRVASMPHAVGRWEVKSQELKAPVQRPARHVPAR